MCKFPLTGCLQIICTNFFAKLVQSVSLGHIAFQKAKSYQNLTTESVSKQRFSLLQEKAVNQAVCLSPQAHCMNDCFLDNSSSWPYYHNNS